MHSGFLAQTPSLCARLQGQRDVLCIANVAAAESWHSVCLSQNVNNTRSYGNIGREVGKLGEMRRCQTGCEQMVQLCPAAACGHRFLGMSSSAARCGSADPP